MVVIIKSMAHVCSNTFLSISLKKDTRAFWRMSLLHWLTVLTHQTLHREKSIGEVLWSQQCHVELNVEDCLNSTLIYSCHWIITGCNKTWIMGNDFSTSLKDWLILYKNFINSAFCTGRSYIDFHLWSEG